MVSGGLLKKHLFIKISKQGHVVALWAVVEVQDSAFVQGGLVESCAEQEIHISFPDRDIDRNC